MKIKLTLLSLFMSTALFGCGGGGSDASTAPSTNSSGTGNVSPTVPATSLTANSGTVTAQFVKGQNARYFLVGVGVQSFAVLSAQVQDANGVMTTLNSNTLTGTPNATQDIAGKAEFAQGRWNVGVATTAAGVATMDGNSNASYHYLAFNNLGALPTSGTKTCSAGKFTAPSFIGGGTTPSSSAYFGTSTGTASVAFDNAGANVTLNITTTAGGSSASGNLSSTITSPSGNAIIGGIGGLSTGGIVTVADNASGSVLVATAYRIQLPNGNTYQGVASFGCQ